MIQVKQKRLGVFFAVALSLLLIPAVAMQFTNEVNWGVGDFVLAAVLLLATALGCEVVLQKLKARKLAILACLALLLLLLLVWAELAVGIL